jgi:magnesium transporter
MDSPEASSAGGVGRKRRWLRPRHDRPGASPGSGALVPAASSPPRLTLFDFSAQGVKEVADASLEICREYFSSTNVTWIHVQGAPDPATLEALSSAYELHPLAAEDVAHLGQRPKLESFEKQLFVVACWPRLVAGQVELMQVSLFLGPTWLVSFFEGDEDPCEPIRVRLRAEPPGRIRQRGADYLFYALLDLVIDHGFPLLEQLSARLEEAEDQILLSPDPDQLGEVHHLKRSLATLRKAFWPERELMASLSREEHPLIKAKTRPYLRDCYDHAIQMLDLVESYREMASGLHDLYLSSISNRMNDIMKVLTIIATIFIPLSFIAGVYGMNFDPSASPWNMPELKWYFGYPLALGLMALVAVLLLLFFRRRRWI